jgi:Flp pilus assembly protein TadG
MVETALVIFPLLLTILGGITLSFAVFAYNNVGWVARQTTRWAVVRGSSSGNPATIETIQTYGRSQVAGLRPEDVTVVAAFAPNNNPGGIVTVEVRYTVTPLVSLFFDPFVVRSTSAATILQ